MIPLKEFEELKEILDTAYYKFNNASFIENDPICIPHLFSKKEDVEISAFLVSTISWGNRKSIIKNGNYLMQLMEMQPHDFILNHSQKELKTLNRFVHRTFNGEDCAFFIQSLKNMYSNLGGLELCFGSSKKNHNVKENIIDFRNIFFSIHHPIRTQKHVSNPDKNSSAKRLCMFLRWMVRKDKQGVDFGIWKNIETKKLCLPLDVHTGNIGRHFGLLNRKQNDWKAVEEITNALKLMDTNDPVKYDFSLFGLGVNKQIELV